MPPLFRSRSPSGFHDRADAGVKLASAIRDRVPLDDPDTIVAVGLARGGVSVAAEVARQLDIRLEAIVIRKLGAPAQPELAIGALAASGERVLNERLIAEIGISEAELDRISRRAVEEAQRICEEIDAPSHVPDIAGKTALLIDDGLATGATMRAAIRASRAQDASRVIVAVPVAPASSVATFRQLADDVITVITPSDLQAVGQWYDMFYGVPTEEVRVLLAADRKRRETGA